MYRRSGLLLCLTASLVQHTVLADPLGEGLAAVRAGDQQAAHRHWLEAANDGDAQAMFLLSQSYEHGTGVAVDPVRALDWLQRSAAAGHPLASYNLGDRYLNGRGVAVDPAEAALWWRRAALQGLVQAQYNLGTLYLRGLGVEADRNQAVWWYRQAAAQGSARARQALAVLERQSDGSTADGDLRQAPAGMPVIAPVRGMDWLARQPSDHYTVQVFASRDPDAVARLLRTLRLAQPVAVYPFRRGGRDWQGVVVGSFGDHRAAEQAMAALPDALQRGGPWVRRIGDLITIVPGKEH